MPDCASCGHPRGGHGPFWPDGCERKTHTGTRCDCRRWTDPIRRLCDYCGQPLNGFASVDYDGVICYLCHPDDPTKPNCYELVTVWGHKIGSDNPEGADADGFYEDDEDPAEVWRRFHEGVKGTITAPGSVGVNVTLPPALPEETP